MRIVTKTLAAAGLTAAATAALLAAGTGTAAANHGSCVGFPTIPLTYACVEEVNPQNAEPQISESGGSVTVPSACYYFSCTDPETVNTPSVSPGEGNVAVIQHNNVVYAVPANPLGL